MPRRNGRSYVAPMFPVQEIHKQLKKIDKNIPASVAVFLAATQEYLAAEIIEKAAAVSRQKGLATIGVNEINEGIKADEDLNAVVVTAMRYHSGKYSHSFRDKPEQAAPGIHCWWNETKALESSKKPIWFCFSSRRIKFGGSRKQYQFQ
ncbi:uncharacterized protein CDAR_59061 [Caerostris darwini]|uniref:Uncharacterized protein n=1 Tax=Caerostris darwini TaxID=1538125 RepID=A0AAV4X5Z7_9ARAC|nr:uncharacterized protein CDAR_59061 [Caerostris darwini]